MLRAAVVVLLLANLAFFAWTRGWMGPGVATPRHGQHEPERLAAQVNAQALVVLAPKAASAAIVAARAAAAVCVEAGPLSDAELAAAETELGAAQVPEGSWTRAVALPLPQWLVFAGRWPDPAARRTREADLRKLGLNVEVISEPAELAPGLVLSRHGSQAEAEAALARLTSGTPPLRGSRIVQMPPPPGSFLRVPRADADLQARLRALPATSFAGGFRPCANDAARP